jgi:hypothetical protein
VVAVCESRHDVDKMLLRAGFMSGCCAICVSSDAESVVFCDVDVRVGCGVEKVGVDVTSRVGEVCVSSDVECCVLCIVVVLRVASVTLTMFSCREGAVFWV